MLDNVNHRQQRVSQTRDLFAFTVSNFYIIVQD